MAAMTESCSVCGKGFEVQFRYQMEERDGGFMFFCSQDCHGKVVSGELDGGVNCAACSKRFTVELVSQVLRIKGERVYACSDPCRTQLLAEAGGARLGAMSAIHAPAPTAPVAAPTLTTAPAPTLASVIATAAPAPAPTPAASVPVASASPAAPPVIHAAKRRSVHGPRRLAVFNHKGGTGKTTTSVSVASGLAAKGLKVLLVDTDSQGNVAVSLDVKPQTSLYHVVVMGMKAKDAAVNVRPNLDVLASNETLAAAELYLAGRQNRDRVLRDRLASACDSYDVVVLDCSPSLSLMNQNALVFAEGILVPVACDFLSLVGVRQVIKTVKNVNSLLHHPVQIYGVLPTFYDARARICRDAVETLTQHFGDRCLTPIRSTTKIKEAPAQGRTIFEYAPDSNAAEDYGRLVDFLVDGPSASQKSSSFAAEPAAASA
ncbi:MAG: ParA family protein [Polyangiaceae bacterium]